MFLRSPTKQDLLVVQELSSIQINKIKGSVCRISVFDYKEKVGNALVHFSNALELQVYISDYRH